MSPRQIEDGLGFHCTGTDYFPIVSAGYVDRQIRLKIYQYKHLNSMQTVSIHTFSAVSADPIRRQILLKFHELVLIRLIRAFEFDANCFDTYLFCIHRPSMLLLFSLFWIFLDCLDDIVFGLLGALPLAGMPCLERLCFWRHFGSKPCSVKIFLIGKGWTSG